MLDRSDSSWLYRGLQASLLAAFLYAAGTLHGKWARGDVGQAASYTVMGPRQPFPALTVVTYPHLDPDGAFPKLPDATEVVPEVLFYSSRGKRRSANSSLATTTQ